ncbi:hypothetical protein PbJCM13498_23780 [Prolixibacter bellariivorans]|uniref:Uncharacterized protein n=1 Tax=Prolixibacter bellariivorans TaxID=314319 RepID=A0A5M4B046_9BACT|nr:hypothetical protein PbJCM13498_23780 [Prolixibacter bellariivorans]
MITRNEVTSIKGVNEILEIIDPGSMLTVDTAYNRAFTTMWRKSVMTFATTGIKESERSRNAV